MISDVRYLLGTFSGRDRRLLIANMLAQFLLATLDLLGIAAILPLMQIVMGSPMDEGTLGTIHRLFGDPTKNHFVILLGALMVAAFVVKAVLASLLTWWTLGYLARLQTDTARRLLKSYLYEDLLAHRRRNLAEVIRTVGASVTDACARVIGGLINTASALMSILLIVALLLVVAPIPTALAVLYFGAVVLILQRVLGPANTRAGADTQESSLASGHALVDSIHGFREAAMHNARSFFLDRYDSANIRNAQASRRANFLGTLPKYVLELVTMVGLTLFIVLSVLTGNNRDTMPTLSLFVAATIKMLPLLVQLTATIGMVRVGRVGLALTVDALRHEPQPAATAADAESPGPAFPSAATADIEVNQVSFAYPGAGRPVLTDVSMRVPAGSSLAICGPSGSGKTTLVDIVLGLIKPDSGTVTYAGVPTLDAGHRWHDVVAYVPQDVYLLDETLAGNVAFGQDPGAQDRERIERCLRTAALGELLDDLPDGLDTRVGDRGARLSGGQRQRVGIARALYREPQVMVLDEATSALDNQTEHEIAGTLRALRGHITTVVVAHRLSTVRDVDRLVFLQRGRIEASGTFAEVAAQSADFARAVALGTLESAGSAQE